MEPTIIAVPATAAALATVGCCVVVCVFLDRFDRRHPDKPELVARLVSEWLRRWRR